MRANQDIGWGVTAMAAACIVLLGATDTLAQEAQLVDRIVAVVNGEIITLGQLERTISRAATDPTFDPGLCGIELPTAAGAAQRGPNDELSRRVLDCMIDDLLAFQHVRRFPLFDVLQDDIDAEYQRRMEQFGSRAAFEDALHDQGLTAAEVRYDLERQALVSNYVEVRYRELIDVSETDVRRYYDEVLRPEMERRGAETPPLEDVREMIERNVAEIEYNRRIDDWIADLRRRATIVVYLW